MADWVFPEDEGTGASEGDWMDAANFAALARAVGHTDFIVTGLNLVNPDYANNEVDVAAGMAVISDASADTVDHSGDGGRGVETRDEGVSYVAISDGVSNVSLTDSATNYVYMKLDLTTDDTISFEAQTSASPGFSVPFLEIGQVDTTNDTTSNSNVGLPSDAHHAKYTDEEAQDSVGNNLGAGLSYDDATPEIALDIVATGEVTLSSGTASVDTGITTTNATFLPAIGVDDPDADTKVSARLFWDDSDGSYWVEFLETDTSVGNPTVNYDIIQVGP